MFGFLFLCIQKFGWISGIRVYLRLKIGRSTTVKLPGLTEKIYLRPNHTDLNTFREIFLREEYHLNFPSGFKPKYIIDAGANIGLTSLFFIRQFPGAQIFSLEPDGGNFECLKKNTAGYPTITPVQTALWNTIGTIEIVDRGYGVRGFMIEESQAASVTSLPATTLSAIIKKYSIPVIDILKMDIEGSEKEVFSHNPEEWLPITRYLIIELHDRMKPGCSQAVFKALGKFNFECSIKGENLVFINTDLI